MNNDIIEMLNRVVCHTTSEYEHKLSVIKMAKALVERDEPKKIKVCDFVTYGIWFDAWECPVCKKIISKKQHFCDHCGQRLDWRGKENG